MQTAEILSVYLQDYFGEMDRLRYTDLKLRQKGLSASLAFGAAGVAYTHWYAGLLLEDPHLLDAAACWSRSALLGQRSGLSLSEDASARASPFAYLNGLAGLYFMKALFAHSGGKPRARRSAVQKFVELGFQSLGGPFELYSGAAGCLAGAAILFHFTGDPQLEVFGHGMAAHLWRLLERRGPGEQREGGLGLAHGAAGLHLAILLWASASGKSLPEEKACSVKSLLDTALREPSALCPHRPLYSWLCNGFPGLILLAARAFQHFGDPWFLSAARQAADVSLSHLPSRPDLCCGRAGVAFAFLALSRVDPGGPWSRHAEELLLSTLLVDRKSWTVAGLYGGEAAIPCLALNRLFGIASGPPCLDFIEIPGRL